MRPNYKKSLELVRDWCLDKGYEDVTFDHNDISYIEWEGTNLNKPKIIKIEQKYNNEIKLYLLLHEIGHHQLRKNKKNYHKKFPILAYAETDKKYIRHVSYRVTSLEEEFKAWEEGYKLGIKFGINIRMDKWQWIKNRCLMKYIRYYSGKK